MCSCTGALADTWFSDDDTIASFETVQLFVLAKESCGRGRVRGKGGEAAREFMYHE